MASSTKRDYDYLFKVVLIGDPGVGKSSLLKRFVDDKFPDEWTTTLGVDFRFCTTTIDKKLVKLQIWDTAGDERFQAVTRAYYNGADGIIAVYDVTNSESFCHAQDWLSKADHHCHGITSKMLVGNKADLVEEKQVSEETAQRFADKLDVPFIETCAKTSANVDVAFLTMAKQLVLQKMKEPEVEVKSDDAKRKQAESGSFAAECVGTTTWGRKVKVRLADGNISVADVYSADKPCWGTVRIDEFSVKLLDSNHFVLETLNGAERTTITCKNTLDAAAMCHAIKVAQEFACKQVKDESVKDS